MTTDLNVAAGEATEINTPAQAEQIPESAPELEQTTPETAESEEDKSQKAAKALQRRLDKRTRDFYAEKARAEQLQAEIEALRQKPKEDTGEVDVDAIATRRASEMLEQKELATKVNSLMSKGKAIEGFEAAASAVVEELGLVDSKGKPTSTLHAFLDVDSPAELIAYVGSDPDRLDSLVGLSPTRLAYRLAAFEAEMKAGSTSKAPKPLAPVKPVAANTAKDPSEMSDADWYRQRKR